MSFRDDMKELAEKVKKYRDEARLQIHLAGEEVKDEWDDLEKEWEKFRDRLDDMRNEAEKTPEDVRERAHDLGESLKSAYRDLRNRLK